MSDTLLKLVAELAAGRLRVIDLTQPLGPDTPLLVLPSPWANTPPFKMWELSHYDDRGPAWYWNAFESGEHTGTHLDAPIHWVSGKDLPNNSVDLLPPSTFMGPACVIDVSAQVARNADFLLTPSAVEAWEQDHGRVPRGAWVLLRTGWAARSGTPDYFNVKEDGPHTPGWSTECSQFLAVDRDVLGVGVETIGTDAGIAGRFTPPFSNHYHMHGSGKLGLTHLCNLELLPPTGAVVIAAPLKIVNGSGSPVRAFAIAPA